VAFDDPDYVPNPASAARGTTEYGRCTVCHGGAAVGGGTAPDLRASAIPPSAEAFESIVRQGALVENGMPRFEEPADAQLADLREFIQSRALILGEETAKKAKRN
jgi:quinohemoprotein ethanol dehydrogenase